MYVDHNLRSGRWDSNRCRTINRVARAPYVCAIEYLQRPGTSRARNRETLQEACTTLEQIRRFVR